MHTSDRLRADDFEFWQHERVDFATFCPDYHPQDRVGVVAVGLEDGVLHTSHALLALTTRFYDHLRATHDDYFDYPQHFAFVGSAGDDKAGGAGLRVGEGTLPLDTPALWEAWSWLDVWPQGKWVVAPTTTAGMVQRVFDYQINRLFWPRILLPSTQADANTGQLPAYVWRMLQTSVKTIYLYGPAPADGGLGVVGERVEVRVRGAAQEIVQESLAKLPAPLHMDAATLADLSSQPQQVERVAVAPFLAALQGQQDYAR